MGLFHRTALPVAAMLLATLSFSANVVYSQDASDTLPFPILPPHTFTALTPEQLTAVDPFPDHYPNLPPAEQRQWVEQQLVQVTDPHTQYKLLQERAYLLIIGNHLPAVRQQCRLHEPLTFDFRYRFRCLAVGSFAYDISVLKWLDLYENTIAEGNFDTGVQSLTHLGWLQAERGHIAQAFSTYQQALEYADQIDYSTVNDVLVNTASLYIMYGDDTYIERGIELHHQALDRLQARSDAYPEEAELHAGSMAIVHHNLGVSYALHLHDYPVALEWFALVPADFEQMYLSATILSALSAAYAGQQPRAEQYLERSYQLPPAIDAGVEYLRCYRQITEVMLGHADEVPTCYTLAETTPLEVQIDIYERLARSPLEHIRLTGLELFFTLYNDKLDNLLKQSSSLAASATELSRLQQKSRLQSELFEREQQLAQAEQQRRDGQIRLALATTVILLLILILISLRFHQNRKLAAQFKSLSVRDSLTGLHNRRFFEQNIDREMNTVSYANQSGHTTQLALVVLDIDYFKEFNDTHGHEAGDKALRAFANRVEGAIKSADMLVRWGGEEFVLVARFERNEDFAAIADRILERVSQEPFAVSGVKGIHLTCTMGAAIYPDCGDIDWRTLLRLADAALYHGKDQGRNRWVCVDAVPTPKQLNLTAGAPFDFEKAVRQGQLKIRTSS